jgi:Rrf2 family iron-sulfur cluster assembly transcriptional regulator
MILKRTRVAVESLVHIATKSVHRPIPAREVAQALSVSLACLESILRVLRENKLVCASKGPGGGYQIHGDLKKVTVLDVVNLFEATEPTSDAGSVGDDFVIDFNAALKSSLNAQNLHDLVSAAAPGLLVVSATKPRFGLRPLPRPASPRGPNSVFQLHSHNSMLLKSIA